MTVTMTITFNSRTIRSSHPKVHDFVQVFISRVVVDPKN